MKLKHAHQYVDIDEYGNIYPWDVYRLCDNTRNKRVRLRSTNYWCKRRGNTRTITPIQAFYRFKYSHYNTEAIWQRITD